MVVNKSKEHLYFGENRMEQEIFRQHTTLVNNQSPNFFIVMDRAIIYNDNASFPWEWVQLRSLQRVSTPHGYRLEGGYTYDLLAQKLQELLLVHRTLENIQSDNAV